MSATRRRMSAAVGKVEAMVETVSPAQARRIALAAQGFGRPQASSVGTRQLNSLIERLGLLQIDSVNVFERSHYLPAFARLGAYDKEALDRLTFVSRSRYLEAWAHEAAFIPVETWPLLRWRMERYRQNSGYRDSWARANQPMIDWLKAELAAKGPLPASAIEHDSNRRSGPWWGWSQVKIGLEVLFRGGQVVSAGRTRFERTYGLPEQILPADVLGRQIETAQAHKRLIEHAARAHGIGTAADLADYFRMKAVDALPAIRELAEEGILLPVTVPGWKSAAWLHSDARIPRRINATSLLSPFDPVVWDRGRAERLFGFRYRIEIYTPAPRRVFGYYVLPLLVDDALVGRVDLKSDRQARVLRVQAAWREQDAPEETAARLAPLLGRIAAWQGLDAVEVMGRGNLAAGLAAELRQPVIAP